ncbi:MAG TPA: TonB family protein [Terriglobales bacterium]|jgi:TonB family protein|nr:TonB family protein [Terriglobales bacterium]
MSLPEENELTELSPTFGDNSEQKQRRQMLIALAILLLALILVLVKDRDFWFPTAPATLSEAEPVEQTAPEGQTQAQTRATTTAAKATTAERSKARPRTPPAAVTPTPAPGLAPVVTSRTVLPPLEVEVVAGDEHRTVQAGTNAVKVDLQPRTPVTTARASSDSGEVADATGRVHLSPGAAEILSRPVEPNYPLLAKQMKVQGAVVLEALIGRDGNIQDLHILSGPAILSAAAREAVKQWRFKPYLQSGQAVETEARITVNFTISTQ